MQIDVLAIGRLKGRAEFEIISRYEKMFSRLGRTCGLGPLRITEFPESKLENQKERKKKR